MTNFIYCSLLLVHEDLHANDQLSLITMFQYTEAVSEITYSYVLILNNNSFAITKMSVF